MWAVKQPRGSFVTPSQQQGTELGIEGVCKPRGSVSWPSAQVALGAALGAGTVYGGRGGVLKMTPF